MVAALVFYASLPLALVFGNVRWLVYNESLYMGGYAKYGIRETTGMSTEQLIEATRQIQAYFRDGSPITLQIQKETGVELLFNAREMQHLHDVRQLLNLLFSIQAGAVAYLPLYAALCLRWYRPNGLSFIAGDAVGAGLFSVALLAAAGAVASSNFEQVFIQFHQMSFDNDLWMLDPRTDYMIRMFPEGFWFESAMQIAGLTAVEALAIAGVGYFIRRRTFGPAVQPTAG